MMGDFNLTLNPEIDRMNTYNNNYYSKNVVLEMMEIFG